MSRPRPQGLVAVALVLLLAAPAVAAKKSSRSTQSSATPARPAQPQAAPNATPEPVLRPTTPVAAPRVTPQDSAPKAAVDAPRPAAVERSNASPPPPESGIRLGVGADFFGESSRLVAEQWINQSRGDESFDYGSGSFFSSTLYVLFPMNKHIRVGPGARIFGNYSGNGNNGFKFGFLSEAFAQAELSFRTFERFELVLGARAGVAILFPTSGSDFGREIDRMQSQGVGVFSGPRLGWLGGLGVGMRRKMTDWFHLRVDLTGQREEVYLFATDQMVGGLRVQKWWRTAGWRFGLTLGAEVAL